MKTELTLNVLQTMNTQEYEDNPVLAVGRAFSVTGRNGTLAVAGYAILAGHRRGWYGGKGGRSCCS